MSDSTLILKLFAGIGDLFLALTLKKHKKNHGFWSRTFKNMRNIFFFWEILSGGSRLRAYLEAPD